MNNTYPSGVDETRNFLCARVECMRPRTEASGLCLECELRYNTTQQKFEARLHQLLQQRRPSEQQLVIFFAEQRRRAAEEV